MKFLKGIERTIKSTYFKIIIAIITALFLAMSIFSSSLDINSQYFNSKNFPLIGIGIGITVFIINLTYSIIELKINKEPAKISYNTSKKNIEINSIAYEKILEMLRSKEFEKITSIHNKNVKNYFKKLIIDTKSKIDSIVSVETLESFDRIRDDSSKQQAFMYSMLGKLSSLQDIDSFIKKEHENCLNSLENYLINWAKSNDLIKHLYSSLISNRLNYNKNKFNFKLDNIESEIKETRSHILEINLRKVVSSNNEVLSKQAIFASMGFFVTGDIVDNIIDNTPFEEVIYHILEDIGATIPFVAPVAIIAKVFRFLYRNRDRTEELEELKKEIDESVSQYLNLICDYTVKKIEEDSNTFINNLLKKFSTNFKNAKKYRDNAIPYL